MTFTLSVSCRRRSGEDWRHAVDSTHDCLSGTGCSAIRAPYWDYDARAAFVGMSRGTRREHLVQAAEEAIAYQIADVVDALNAGLPAASGFIIGRWRRHSLTPSDHRYRRHHQSCPFKSQPSKLSAAGAAYVARSPAARFQTGTGFWLSPHRTAAADSDPKKRYAEL